MIFVRSHEMLSSMQSVGQEIRGGRGNRLGVPATFFGKLAALLAGP